MGVYICRVANFTIIKSKGTFEKVPVFVAVFLFYINVNITFTQSIRQQDIYKVKILFTVAQQFCS